MGSNFIKVLSAPNQADVDVLVQAAQNSFESWSQTSREERLELLDCIIEQYERRMDEMAFFVL